MIASRQPSPTGPLHLGHARSFLLAWWHVPLVTDASGRRLAKRSDDASLVRLRAVGADARQIVSWVARSSGIEAPDRAHARELVAGVDIDRLPRSEVRILQSDLKSFGLH